MEDIQNQTAETTVDQVKDTEVNGASEVADTSNEAQFTDTDAAENGKDAGSQSSKTDADANKAKDDAEVKDNFANKGEEKEISTKKYVYTKQKTRGNINLWSFQSALFYFKIL